MRTLSIILFSIFIYACSSENNSENEQRNYEFAIDKLVENQITEIQYDSLCKLLVNDTTIVEQVKIEAEKIKNDLLELKNYDINKPAFKNVFEVIENDSLTIYKSKDPNTTIKTITVYGKLDMPSKVQFELINLNNLYESTKYIDWQYNEYIRIKTIQKVKAMSSDTIDIVSYLNGNCAITSSMLSTGK
jgi:hypothetical protein